MSMTAPGPPQSGTPRRYTALGIAAPEEAFRATNIEASSDQSSRFSATPMAAATARCRAASARSDDGADDDNAFEDDDGADDDGADDDDAFEEEEEEYHDDEEEGGLASAAHASRNSAKARCSRSTCTTTSALQRVLASSASTQQSDRDVGHALVTMLSAPLSIWSCHVKSPVAGSRRSRSQYASRLVGIHHQTKGQRVVGQLVPRGSRTLHPTHSLTHSLTHSTQLTH